MTDARMIAGVEVKPLAVFEGLTIENENFDGCDLRGATFVNCVIQNCNFSQAILVSLDDEDDDNDPTRTDQARPPTVLSRQEEEAIRREYMKRLYSIDAPSPWRGTGLAEERPRRTSSPEIDAKVESLRKWREGLQVEAAATSGQDEPTAVRTVFLNSKLDGCSFADGYLSTVVFQACELSDLSFEKTNAEFVWFVQSKLSNINFQESLFEEVLFIESVVRQADFSGSTPGKTSFDDSQLISCDFRQLQSDFLEFAYVSLVDCDFSEAEMYEAAGRDMVISGSTNLDITKLRELKDEEEEESE